MATTNITTKPVLTPVLANEVVGVKDGVLGRFELAALPLSTAAQSSNDAVIKYRPIESVGSISMIGNSLFENSYSLGRIAIGYLKPAMGTSYGVGGAPTSALAGQAANVPINSACMIMEGTNDAASSVSTATHIANLRAAVAVLLSRGVTPIMIASPPRDTVGTIGTINSYVIAERIWCKEEGIHFFDPWSEWTDTDGTWVSGASSDGDHPDPITYWQVGKRIAEMIRNDYPQVYMPRVNSGSGVGLISNPLQLVDTNVDGLPDGWGGFGIPTFSAIADATYPGRGKRAFSSISTSTTVELYRELTYVPGTVDAGDELLVSGFIGTENMSNCKVRVYCVGGVVIFATRENQSVTGVSGRFIAATGPLQLWIEVSSVSGSAFTCDLTFGGWNVLNVTKTRVA
jgi:hypothetical protein